MGWVDTQQIEIVELLQLVVSIVLAVLLARIGWRFTNIRAAKDLVLEEGRRSLQVCNSIRKELRKIPDSEIPKYENFIEYLDDLGSFLWNCQKMYSGISKKGMNGNMNNIDKAFNRLRIALSGDSGIEDHDTPNALMCLKEIQGKIIDLMVDVNN
ncbi:MAG: hypothetical protein OXE59_02865 [Bacteroidetes bacterium]|nr:hypothetical protein [Bacteroidota bacterium]